MVLISLAVQKVETVQGHRKITSRGCPFWRDRDGVTQSKDTEKRQKEGEKEP